ATGRAGGRAARGHPGPRPPHCGLPGGVRRGGGPAGNAAGPALERRPTHPGAHWRRRPGGGRLQRPGATTHPRPGRRRARRGAGGHCGQVPGPGGGGGAHLAGHLLGAGRTPRAGVPAVGEPAERRGLPRPVGGGPGALPGADPAAAVGTRCAGRARRVHRAVPARAPPPPPPPLTAPPTPVETIQAILAARGRAPRYRLGAGGIAPAGRQVPTAPADTCGTGTAAQCSARTCRAAVTRFVSAETVSSYPRVFSPQSGFTHSCPRARGPSARRSRPAISSVDGTLGEWMS